MKHHKQKRKMNRFLGYNIASEPTIFPHEKHRYPLVDGATYLSLEKIWDTTTLRIRILS